MSTDSLAPIQRADRNLRIAGSLALLVFGMVGLAYAAVPLYSIFCQVTGFGGTTQVASDNTKGIIAREMNVRFDATVAPGISISVRPASDNRGPIGSKHTVTFLATNLSRRTVFTTAAFNVTPDLAGLYFNKIECFCFTEQTLAPGETAEMPVTYFIDPDLDADQDLDTVRDITLSYTFYPSQNEGN
jgi:cytochrome c oxidase assembly protein subunit 11